jgi:hypothetical protein
MLKEKVLGIPVWVLLLLCALAVNFYYCYDDNKVMKKVVVEEQNKKSKEKFSDTQNKIKVLNFNTVWCGWSKRFQPEWEHFTALASKESNIEAVDVKCDDKSNEGMCDEYKVPGFPYVIIDNGKTRIPYNGERTANAIMSYVKSL